jgi:hypothetical protein
VIRGGPLGARILTAAMFFMVLALFLVFRCPRFWNLPVPCAAPVVAWLYVPTYSYNFVLLSLHFRGGRAPQNVLRRDPFRRARPG